MLSQHGEFYPYAATVSLDGQKRLVAAQGEADRPGSGDLLELLYAGVRADAGLLRAAAFVSDVRIGGPAPGEGIRIDLEHSEGVALTVVLAYRVNRHGVEYGEMAASPGQRRIWTEPL
jgi:hypothetical protein